MNTSLHPPQLFSTEAHMENLKLFTGEILRKHRDFCILQVDGHNLQAFAHKADFREAEIDFDGLRLRDRFVFRVLPSKKYPDRFCVFGIKREAEN
jgi:hypothetical protein